MPIYEYTCEDCDERFEKFVRSMTAAAGATCPRCGGTHTKKGWSVFGTGKSNGSLGNLEAPRASSCTPAGT